MSRTPPYGQWPIDTHKNIILSGGSSQIDGLEAGNFTFEDSLLIRWENVVFIHFLQLTSTWSGGKLQRWSRLPPRHQFDYFQHWGWCFYGWNLVITRTVVSLTFGQHLEHLTTHTNSEIRLNLQWHPWKSVKYLVIFSHIKSTAVGPSRRTWRASWAISEVGGCCQQQLDHLYHLGF